MFSHRRKSSQESRSDRDGMRLAHRAVQGENEALSRLSESDSDTRLILEEQGDQLPSEAKSEVLKQRCRADLLDCSTCELQRQIHSSRIGDWSYQSRIWNITKRTSLAEKEHIEKRMLVVLVKWKTWKELRNCELTNSPGQDLTGSHATIHELTSQIQELQEKANCMNDSGEFQDVQSICTGKLSHVPSQPAVVASPCRMPTRDQSLRPETWNLFGTSGNVFDNPPAPIDSASTPQKRNASSLESYCYIWWSQCSWAWRGL